MENELIRRKFLGVLAAGAGGGYFLTTNESFAKGGEKKGRYPYPKAKDYEWFRKAAFGVFIHWGVDSVLDTGKGSWAREGRSSNIGSDSVYDEPPVEITSEEYKKYEKQDRVPRKIFDNLFHVFNPVEFNADEMVKMVKDSGAGYIVFTVKHHDGFCMYDSAVTEYDIMSTPYKRDIARELIDACRKYGIEMIWYYSIVDWHHPEYTDRKHSPEYSKYFLAQIKELCTNYGDVKGFWWDGGGGGDTWELYDLLHKLQPGFITNGRIVGDGKPDDSGLLATPEQKIGKFRMDRPWESCAVIQEQNWFHNSAEAIKSFQSCLMMLISSVGGDGNLLLDFGPDGQGRIREDAKSDYLNMG